jgi:hypothetical protein
LPDEAGNGIEVKMLLVAPESELARLRPPAGLRQPLELRVSLERLECAAQTGAPPLERRTLRAEPGVTVSLSSGLPRPASPSGERLRVQLEYRLDAAGTALLGAGRFLAEGRQLFFSPA